MSNLHHGTVFGRLLLFCCENHEVAREIGHFHDDDI